MTPSLPQKLVHLTCPHGSAVCRLLCSCSSLLRYGRGCCKSYPTTSHPMKRRQAYGMDHQACYVYSRSNHTRSDVRS
ncbi:unnamed protein product [Ectocarpus sp. 13 AM-2016]